MIIIDPRSRIPIFEQIKNSITELIYTGVLKPHDQIPSIRGLAQDLGLNVNTVKKAFQDLESFGIIYTLSGRGSFVSENIPKDPRLKAKLIENVNHAVRNAMVNGISKDEVYDLVTKIYENTSKGHSQDNINNKEDSDD